MQAIRTKYMGPTNHLGGRVKAWCDTGTIVLAWDHELNVADNHTAAAVSLRAKLGWANRGMTRDGLPQRGTPNAYCFVLDYASERVEATQAGGRVEEHSRGNCRLCELAIWDVEAPSCPIAIQLVRDAREAAKTEGKS